MMARLQQAAYHASGWMGTAILVLTLAGVPAVRADEIAAAGVAIGEKIVPMVVSITVHKDETSAPATSGVATVGAQADPHNGAGDIKTFVASGFVIDPSGRKYVWARLVSNFVTSMICVSCFISSSTPRPGSVGGMT